MTLAWPQRVRTLATPIGRSWANQARGMARPRYRPSRLPYTNMYRSHITALASSLVLGWAVLE